MAEKKPSWRDLFHDKPGRRFRNRYERLHAQGRSAAGRFVRLLLGVVLVALGIVFGLLPGPGFVPLLAGLALFAGESARVAGWLDRAEVKVRGWLE